MTPDLINGAFEMIGGLLSFLNIWRLWREKRVAGVSLTPVFFFSLWGLWNLFYYPHLGQIFSFIGGLVVLTANAIWLAFALHYRKKRRTA